MASVNSMASQGDYSVGNEFDREPSPVRGPGEDFVDKTVDKDIVDKAVNKGPIEDPHKQNCSDIDSHASQFETEIQGNEGRTGETKDHSICAQTETESTEIFEIENSSKTRTEIAPDVNSTDSDSKTDGTVSGSEDLEKGCEISKAPDISSTIEKKRSDDNNRVTELSYSQVCRLHLVMTYNLHIKSRPHYQHFPTIDVEMHTLVQTVRSKLMGLSVPIRDIRLNGGAASHVLGNSKDVVYNDFDLIFRVDLGAGEAGSERVKHAVLLSLQEFIPSSVHGPGGEKPSLSIIEEVYINKMVKVSTDCDKWSLISLANSKGCDVELKFVDKMKRQFEFSVDSFQINLDNLLLFYQKPCPIEKHFYPRVYAESVFGPIGEALEHLNSKLIATTLPEQIRGGGLLKYCDLIARGYSTACDFSSTKKYMCSRFFIDFPDVTRQRAKLESYLANHFPEHRGTRSSTTEGRYVKYDFLTTLYSVVEESSVCLMGQERLQTLQLIQFLAQHTLVDLQRRYGDVQPHVYSSNQSFCRRNASVKNRFMNSSYPMYMDSRHHSQYYPAAYQYMAPVHADNHMVPSVMPYFNCLMPYYVVSS